jgi:HEAT repeat protein
MDDRINSPGPPAATTSVADLVPLSSNIDGFKRENAVRRLGMIGNPAAIPALIIRANDWVPQVRAAAYDALIKMLTPANAEAIVASLPQFLHLQACRRGDHAALLQAVQDFLVRDGNVDTLKAAWYSTDLRVARLVTRLLISKRALSAAEIIEQGLSHDDVAIRSIVIDLLRDLGPEAFEHTIEKALHDRYMPVRREAFQQFMRRFPDRGRAVAKRFLFDRSAAVRELALEHLSVAGEPVEDLYSQALSASSNGAATVQCVLWGWSALNCRSRVNQIEQMLTSPLASVRRAALQAFVKLSPQTAACHLQAALADSSGRVANEAARLIRKLGVSIDVDALIAMAKSQSDVRVTYACYRVARCANKWDWLKYVLAVYPAAGSRVPREAFCREIQAWENNFNRTGAQSDPRTLREIAELLSACKSQLPPKQVELLEFTLRTC